MCDYTKECIFYVFEFRLLVKGKQEGLLAQGCICKKMRQTKGAEKWLVDSSKQILPFNNIC